MGPDELAAAVKGLALGVGFSSVGISRAEALPGGFLQDWLRRGFHGRMEYLARAPEMRLDPRVLFPPAKTVLSLTWDYSSREEPAVPGNGVVSRYARGRDYHLVLREKLEELLAWIQILEPAAQGRCVVDSAPVMEKAWAARSGLGWIGKHTNLISQQRGSWFFLGELLLNLELTPDKAVPDRCGNCTRCIEACPTGAIVAPHVLDARKCISYLTIELKGPMPVELREGVGSLVFGCDICQEVCPWNERAARVRFGSKPPPEDGAAPAGEGRWSLAELSRLTPTEFSSRFSGSPVKRAKWVGLLRNVATAMGNQRTPEFHDDLVRLAEVDDPVVSEHAEWALNRLSPSADDGG